MKWMLVLSWFFSLAAFAQTNTLDCSANKEYIAGVGIYDITGPAAEEGMMGYGMITQQTAGIYQRLWARAFVLESPCNGKRIAIVNTDLGMVFQGVKQQVVSKLKARFGDRYNDDNVLLTATHTHSGPGGFSTDMFYNLTTLGFDKRHFETVVNGIVEAISRAEANKGKAQIKLAQGALKGISFNRSPLAYLQNPAALRERYQADVDTDMFLLRIDSPTGKSIGMINWFPLHGVSMNNKNKLINGDNKGYAEYLFEQDFHSDYGQNAFVAAFAQANAGDVSPNLLGHEGGEGAAGLRAVEQVGRAQYERAKQLYGSADEMLQGDIDYRHTFVAMDQLMIEPQYADNHFRTTCPGAIGVSMFAGTQDGEGLGKQGINCDKASKILPHFICTCITTACQGVKPIAIQTGKLKPYPWTPQILPLQIIKLGNVIIVAAPFELTTMTGRRIKEAVAKVLAPNETHHIVLAALSNAYAGYVATFEEYQLQRYEGASTHFGPWTAAALEQEYTRLARALVHHKTVPQGPIPRDLSQTQMNWQPGVIFDDKPSSKQFGDVYQDAQASYKAGDSVEVSFWGAHPKNNYRTQDSFLAVEKWDNGTWHSVRYDRDWDTEYHWQRKGIAYSVIKIVWRIPQSMPTGQYRIVHYGDWKAIGGRLTPYMGISKVFTVVSSS